MSLTEQLDCAIIESTLDNAQIQALQFAVAERLSGVLVHGGKDGLQK